jgi:hypothetical protein
VGSGFYPAELSHVGGYCEYELVVLGIFIPLALPCGSAVDSVFYPSELSNVGGYREYELVVL